jgi:metal transporter CNNM
VGYPIAKLLDCVLGANETNTYKKAELKSFLQFHRSGEEPLRDDEISILNGVLELNTKKAQTIMTPMKVCITILSQIHLLNGYGQDVVSLSADTILDCETLDHMYVIILVVFRLTMSTTIASLNSGYSRFPVHDPGHPLAFRGLLLVKKVLIIEHACW